MLRMLTAHCPLCATPIEVVIDVGEAINDPRFDSKATAREAVRQTMLRVRCPRCEISLQDAQEAVGARHAGDADVTKALTPVQLAELCERGIECEIADARERLATARKRMRFRNELDLERVRDAEARLDELYRKQDALKDQLGREP